MENVMTNEFADLSSVEMEFVSGGGKDWGAAGYEFGKGWCDFWGFVGGFVYSCTHGTLWEPIPPYNG